MRIITVLSALLVLAACAPPVQNPAHAEHMFRDDGAVTYYDRNNDGLADFELHEPDCDDCYWALVDTDFNGRYERRVLWAYAPVKDAVDVPVPTNVVLVVGQPEAPGWGD